MNLQQASNQTNLANECIFCQFMLDNLGFTSTKEDLDLYAKHLYMKHKAEMSQLDYMEMVENV